MQKNIKPKFFSRKDIAGLRYIKNENEHYDYLDTYKFQKPVEVTTIDLDGYLIKHNILEKISFSETFSRLINLHVSLLIPYFFYLCLKIKYKFKKENLYIFVPCIMFFSPYFRSSSIWLGNENLSLIFLLISLYSLIFSKNGKSIGLDNFTVAYLPLTILLLNLSN